MAAFEMMPPCSLATRASIPDEHQALSRRTALTLTHPIGTLPGGVVLVEAVDGEGATMLVELEPRLTESLAADRNADGRVRLRPEPGSMRRLPARRFSRASCGDSRTTSTTAGRAGISSAADLPPGGCSLLPETDPDGAICTQPISTIPSVPKTCTQTEPNMAFIGPRRPIRAIQNPLYDWDRILCGGESRICDNIGLDCGDGQTLGVWGFRTAPVDGHDPAMPRLWAVPDPDPLQDPF